MLDRASVINSMHAALNNGRPDYARQLAKIWLAEWSGDFTMQLLLARAHLLEGEFKTALDLLSALSIVDPENASVPALLVTAADSAGDVEAATLAIGMSRLLGGAALPRVPWLVATRESWLAAQRANWPEARAAAERAMQADAPLPLPAVLLLKSHWTIGEHELALPLARAFYERWPTCIPINLCLAESLLRTGDYGSGVALLHDVVALDPSAEVASRYWGRDHAFRPIWPPEPRISPPGPMPPEVAEALGTNRLAGHSSAAAPSMATAAPAMQPASWLEVETHAPKASHVNQPASPSAWEVPAQFGLSAAAPPAAAGSGANSELQQLREQLRNLNLGGKPRSQAGARLVPVHVIVSSRRNLEQKFAIQGATDVLDNLRALAQATEQHTRRPCILLLADCAESLLPLGLKPVNAANAWDVKLLLHDLQTKLSATRRRIGSVLLVGGDDVVPFHRLPNPTDDHDRDVPSDNPYGTPDENYFVPEWPVGRLPSTCNNDPRFLIGIIRGAIRGHQEPKASLPPFIRMLHWIFPMWQPNIALNRTFGYSADVWREASREIFNLIGRSRDLRTSPPLEADSLPTRSLAPADLAYFNLHGIEDSAEWYGQPAAESSGVQYPTALRPEDIGDSLPPAIIFSEACYGANIIGKQQSEAAICLRLLESGSRAMVGSTKISYGSVSAPLISADLLAQNFWQAVLLGLPVGEALRRAKLGLAHTMSKRQGFLDGEDQKTLISFVLYGDPLLTGPNIIAAPSRSSGKSMQSAKGTLNPACSKGAQVSTELPGGAATLSDVKRLVARYLPGAGSFDVRVNRAQVGCNCGSADCLAGRHGTKSAFNPERTVYTVRNTVQLSQYTQRQYARVTVDKSGKITKLAVSR